MRGEIPDCKRCCCCLPLRYGLLVWGYVKLSLEGLLIPFMIYYLLASIVLISMFLKGKDMLEILIDFSIYVLTLTSVITDFIATIVFIIGGHMKSVKLLRGFYFYSIAMLIVTALLIISAVCSRLGFWFTKHISLRSWRSDMTVYSIFFVILVSQTYFLLLLRSEVNKLRVNIGEFRFVNNAAEAERTIQYVEPIEEQSEETGTEYV